MHFKEFEKKMRFYEDGHNYYIPSEYYIVVRLDGRGFTALTKESNIPLNRPFDTNFKNWMDATVKHLMENSGFNILLGYVQSDEISLLIDPSDNTFGRLDRKIISTLASMASAKFSVTATNDFKEYHDDKAFDIIASFDARLSLLPDEDLVADYFSWRAGDAVRNSLNTCLYWNLRDKKGLLPQDATVTMMKMSKQDKLTALKEMGVDFDKLLYWQKYGTLFTWEAYDKVGYNPVTDTNTVVQRNKIEVRNHLDSTREIRDIVTLTLYK